MSIKHSDSDVTRLSPEDIDAVPHAVDGEMVLLFLERGTAVEEVTEDDPIGITTDTWVDADGDNFEWNAPGDGND